MKMMTNLGNKISTLVTAIIFTDLSAFKSGTDRVRFRSPVIFERITIAFLLPSNIREEAKKDIMDQLSSSVWPCKTPSEKSSKSKTNTTTRKTVLKLVKNEKFERNRFNNI
jgi:hypothetical protein